MVIVLEILGCCSVIVSTEGTVVFV